MRNMLTRLTSRFPIFGRPNSDTFLASVRKFFLPSLLYANISRVHCLREPIVLETAVRYSENRFALHMVFKQGEQAKTIPYMLCAKARAEPIPRVVVGLRETSVINASTIGSGGPSPYLQLIVILSMKPMYTP
jgi:hypothetical protein